jgi:hypothetical protein
VQNIESPTGKILKAKYNPKGDFLDAKIGSRPSLAWRSIFRAKNLLQAGLCWRIGRSEIAVAVSG